MIPKHNMKTSVEWLRLTCDQLEKAREQSEGVCILPVGVIERHGSHLPLGTDVFEADALAKGAAEKEYAVVLPPLHYSVNANSAHCLGAIDIRPRVLLDFIQNLLDEVARNGFRKILLLNFHGGNRFLLPLILQEHKTRPEADYELYLPNPHAYESIELRPIMETQDNHAGELETSLIQHIVPETVDQASLPDYGATLKENYPVPGVVTPVDWVASYPDLYAGDATKASAQKGAQLFEAITTRLAKLLQTIKADTASHNLRKEYQRRRANPPLK